MTNISGSIINNQLEPQKNIEVSLKVYKAITSERVTLETTTDENGRFHLQVPIETDFALAHLFLSPSPHGSAILICLTADSETKINIQYGDVDNLKVSMVGNYPITNTDAITAVNILGEIIMEESTVAFEIRPVERLYDKSPDYFVQKTMQSLEQKYKIIESDTCISTFAKAYIKSEYALFVANYVLFDYEHMMNNNIMFTNSEENRANINISTISDKSYYSFLKYLDLNNPHKLYSSEYYYLLQNILTNETLNISLLGDSPIDNWVVKVKQVLSDLTGIADGMFYDVLIASAFCTENLHNLKPLSDKQIENIKKYYQDGEIEKILLRKNKEVIELNRTRGTLTINDTPPVAKEELLNAIVSKYKGKVVVIDFWATWCGPCLEAMKKSHQTRFELLDKDVVFVYLADISSPQALWREKIEGLGGEHYYLSGEEWKYLFDYFETSGIPFYLFYDKKGILKYRQSGYIGNEDLKNKVETLF